MNDPKLHFMIGYLRGAARDKGGMSVDECQYLADHLENAPNVAALQQGLLEAFQREDVDV
jgi:hypothetical protein